MVLQKTLEMKYILKKYWKTQFLSQYYVFRLICVDILHFLLKIKLVSNTFFLSGIRSGTKQVACLEHFSTVIPQTYLKSRA